MNKNLLVASEAIKKAADEAKAANTRASTIEAHKDAAKALKNVVEV